MSRDDLRRFCEATSGVSLGSMLTVSTSNWSPTFQMVRVSVRMSALSTMEQSIGQRWYARFSTTGRRPSKYCPMRTSRPL